MNEKDDKGIHLGPGKLYRKNWPVFGQDCYIGNVTDFVMHEDDEDQDKQTGKEASQDEDR